MIGAMLTKVAPGAVEIELPFRDDLTQQHGFVHAGVVTAIADSACGYAALSLMPPATACSRPNSRSTCSRPRRASGWWRVAVSFVRGGG
jgi:acyl-coenzyme A thioesterase PaaI-like protein